MNRPILVLQYPNPGQDRTIALAATRNPLALKAFKHAVIQEARQKCVNQPDELLKFLEEHELVRLGNLFDVVIPEK